MATRTPWNAPDDMKMPLDLVSRLMPAGRKFAKPDIVELWRSKVSANASSVMLGAIELIEPGFAPAAMGHDVACCCSPCCCATTVINPIGSRVNSPSCAEEANTGRRE